LAFRRRILLSKKLFSGLSRVREIQFPVTYFRPEPRRVVEAGLNPDERATAGFDRSMSQAGFGNGRFAGDIEFVRLFFLKKDIDDGLISDERRQVDFVSL
jgi:hypothetical protein